ncbi:MAG: hypothetical protein L0H93_02375 [Nocardioides sp.]|nr:hypothetical protein [Nocardioides sp.]
MGSLGNDRIYGGGRGDTLYDGAYWMREYAYKWVPKDSGKDVDLLAGGAGADTASGGNHDTVGGGPGSDDLSGGRLRTGPRRARDGSTEGQRSRGERPSLGSNHLP